MLYGAEDIALRRRFIDEADTSDARKRMERRKLDALLGFAESCQCRRQVLLRYFGDDSEPCGNCDVCLDPKETVDGTIEAQKILSAVYRTGQRFGAAHVVVVLEGKTSEKISAAGHDMLSVYGIGKDRPRSEWQSLIRQLVGARFLSLDVAGYGGLSITEKGRALLKGEEPFRYRRDMVRRSKKKEKKLRTVVAQTELNAERDELLQRLKALRWKLSRQRHVPPYVIFSDRSLIDMAARLPLTRMDFGEIHGVGAAKIDQFADIFLAEIAAFSSGS